MIAISALSVSDHLSLEEAVARLKSSPLVDGVAEFGSRATARTNQASDYDFLILVETIPANVFQMITTIDGRLADIVLVPIKTVDLLLTAGEQLGPGSFEALFIQKMRTTHILYDATKRLDQAKQLVTSERGKVQPFTDHHESDLYATWFWQGFGLLHLERMAQSQDPVHLSAFDMMLTSCLPGTWRSYFEIRRIPWEGDKAAIQYWMEHDAEYFQAVTNCLSLDDRNEKLTAYRKLVERTIEPIGKPIAKGNTAVILAGTNSPVDLQKTLRFWQSLIDAG